MDPFVQLQSIVRGFLCRRACSVDLDVSFSHHITDFAFDNIPKEIVIEIFKDGRPFSHFIESWLATNYPVIHIHGCKKYDFRDLHYPWITYDEKTFTKQGCKFMPSNMIGQGRVFDKDVFNSKSKKLIYCIVSNIHFPTIKVRFCRGTDLIKKYPNGTIPYKDHNKFFA
jgi:hypothetical protein